MKVKKITASVNDAQAVPQVLDNEGVSFQKDRYCKLEGISLSS